jgi:hypothetical protein
MVEGLFNSIDCYQAAKPTPARFSGNVRVWNKIKSAPLPKREPGATVATPMCAAEYDMVRSVLRKKRVDWVPAPWVAGVHFDSSNPRRDFQQSLKAHGEI